MERGTRGKPRRPCEHETMRFAVDVPNFGDFADPRVVADLARRAEDAGWDGLFVWDHVTHRKELKRKIADPWILLTAAALATERLRLGTLITPLARRRVSKLAREVTTRLDEGLEALNLLWSGDPVTYRGQHVVVEDVTFLPTPVQRPRVPVWVGGEWPSRPPMRHAARWDGAVPLLLPGHGSEPLQPDAATVREIHAFLAGQRVSEGRDREPFDLVLSGTSPPDRGAAADLTGLLEEAGGTWWVECLWDDLERAEPMLRRADQGPPRRA